MKTLKHFTGKLAFWMVLFVGLCFTACNDNGVGVTDSPVDKPRGNFQFSEWHEVGSVNGDLRIDTVKILMKDIHLNVANSSNTHNFSVGPLVIVCTPNNSARLVYIHHDIIPMGTYDKVQFKIHKPGGNETPPDPEFLEGNSRYSMIVKGTYNSVPFVFKHDKSVVQMLTFPNHIVVAQTMTNVTLRLFPYRWFQDENNNNMNPMNPSNWHKIEKNIRENIKGNFRAFRDDDGNGQPD